MFMCNILLYCLHPAKFMEVPEKSPVFCSTLTTRYSFAFSMVVVLSFIIVVSIALNCLQSMRVKRQMRMLRRTHQMTGSEGPHAMSTTDPIHPSSPKNDLAFLVLNNSGIFCGNSQQSAAYDIVLEQTTTHVGRYSRLSIGRYRGNSCAVKRYLSSYEMVWKHEMTTYDKALRHEAIVCLIMADIFFCQDGSTELWLVLEYHQNGSLYDFLRGARMDAGKCDGDWKRDGDFERSLSTRDAIRILVSICSGLDHLHTEISAVRGKPAVAHRDVKTANVLVKEDLTCCIADFENAVFLEQGLSREPDENPSIPLVVFDEGTNRYKSPEIIVLAMRLLSIPLSKAVVQFFKQADIFAMGHVMWEVCRRTKTAAGNCEPCRVAYEDLVPVNPSIDDMFLIVVAEQKRPSIEARWREDHVLDSISDLMQQCWCENPCARPSAMALKQKLLEAAQSQLYEM